MELREINTTPPPNEALIRALERLLEDARSGQLQGLAYCLSWREGATGSGYALPTLGHGVRVMGEMEWLKQKILTGDPAVQQDLRGKLLYPDPEDE